MIDYRQSTWFDLSQCNPDCVVPELDLIPPSLCIFFFLFNDHANLYPKDKVNIFLYLIDFYFA